MENMALVIKLVEGTNSYEIVWQNKLENSYEIVQQNNLEKTILS